MHVLRCISWFEQALKTSSGSGLILFQCYFRAAEEGIYESVFHRIGLTAPVQHCFVFCNHIVLSKKSDRISLSYWNTTDHCFPPFCSSNSWKCPFYIPRPANHLQNANWNCVLISDLALSWLGPRYTGKKKEFEKCLMFHIFFTATKSLQNKPWVLYL